MAVTHENNTDQMPLVIKNLALPLWVGLFCLLAGMVLPWQAGMYLHKHLAVTLDIIAGNVHAEAEVRDYQQGIWQSSATVVIQSALLREPIELHLTMRHGPWLGFDSSAPTSLGWFSVQTRLPSQGGMSIFPAQSAVTAWFNADLLGQTRLGGRLHDKAQNLGVIQLRSLLHDDTSQCRGEVRLPGFKWLMPAGDLIAADVVLRANLLREHEERRGDFSIDALRVAWVVQPTAASSQQRLMPLSPPSLLIEQPRIDVLLAQSTQLNAAWASARGINLSSLGLRNNLELGRLNTRLSWSDIHWNALLSSVDAHSVMRFNIPTLNAATYALGEGKINLETLELQHAKGQLSLTAELHAHTPVQDWRDLEFHLHSQLSQSMLVEWMLDTHWVNTPQAALEQLASLRQHGWLEELTPGQLGATLNLWRGEMSLSTRRVPLNALVQ